jgi:hypothetical protein
MDCKAEADSKSRRHPLPSLRIVLIFRRDQRGPEMEMVPAGVDNDQGSKVARTQRNLALTGAIVLFHSI